MKTKNYIEQIRTFNRFYTDVIGLLNQHLLNSQYSLAEARIIYEIYQARTITASQIMYSMHIDKSYLSRLLKKLERKGLIQKMPSNEDGRTSLLSLTEKGEREFTQLNSDSEKQIGGLIDNLSQTQKDDLISGMKSIMKNLNARNNEN
jgi:DNA-binding MarR family transcriptional regulator